MNLIGVKEISARPNDDGTFHVRVITGCADQGRPLGEIEYKAYSKYILEFPRAKIEITALASSSGGELLRFTDNE